MTAVPGTTEAHVEVGGRTVRLTNLDKVLWPVTGMTKGEMIDYYVRVAPVLLPHVADHPVTLHRFPDGVDGPHWFETRVHRPPSWLRTQRYVFRSGKEVDVAVVDDLPGLLWAANTAAVELHPYLAATADLDRPTVVVFDLDPGPPAGLLEAARLALRLRALLAELGLEGLAKTSGGKGMHVYVPVDAGRHTYDETKAFARAVARHLATEDPGGVIDVMPKARRVGKIFIDWSQNDHGKSTIAPYSLRGLPYPTVSVPVTWEEVERACARSSVEGLVFLAGELPARLDDVGDLFEAATRGGQSLPA